MSKLLNLATGTLRIALVLAIVPFFVNISVTQNGVYRDYVAIGAGGAAILFALISLTTILSEEDKGARFGLFGAALVLGAVQLMRGFGVF